MSKALLRYWTDIRFFFQLKPTIRQQYLFHPDKHFTRRRKLSFAQTATLILSLLKNPWPLSCMIFLPLSNLIP